MAPHALFRWSSTRPVVASPAVTAATYATGGFDVVFTDPPEGTTSLALELRCGASELTVTAAVFDWDGGSTGHAHTGGSVPAGCDDTGDPVEVRLSAQVEGLGLEPSAWLPVTPIEAPTVAAAEYVEGIEVTLVPPAGTGPTSEVTGYEIHLVCGTQDFPWRPLAWDDDNPDHGLLPGGHACDDTTTAQVEVKATIAGTWTTPTSNLLGVRPIGAPIIRSFSGVSGLPQSFNVVMDPPLELGPGQYVTHYLWSGGCDSNPTALGGMTSTPTFQVSLCGHESWVFRVQARINNAWVTPTVEISGSW